MNLSRLHSADQQAPEQDAPMPRTDEEWRTYVATELRLQQAQLQQGAARMAAIEQQLTQQAADLKANTEATARIEAATATMVSTWASIESGFKVIGWMGGAVEWLGKKLVFLSIFAAACFGLWKALLELAKDKLP
jgi:hypothetical protein